MGSHSVFRPQGRAGVSGSELETLVRSGLFAQLAPAAQAVLTVLHNLRDPDTGLTRLSYRGISVYTGVQSSATVSKAITELRKIHAVQLMVGVRLGGITRECNVYRVTLDDEKLVKMCSNSHRELRHARERERAIRFTKRLLRQAESRNVSAGSLKQRLRPALHATTYNCLQEPKEFKTQSPLP